MGLQSHRPCPQSRPQVLKFLSPCYSCPCHWRPCPHSRFPRTHPNKWVPAPGSPASIGDPAGPGISLSIPPTSSGFLTFLPLLPSEPNRFLVLLPLPARPLLLCSVLPLLSVGLSPQAFWVSFSLSALRFLFCLLCLLLFQRPFLPTPTPILHPLAVRGTQEAEESLVCAPHPLGN